MAHVVAAFGSSHSTMLVSSVEHWQEMFDRVDRRAPINDFDGIPRTFDDLLKNLPPDAAAKIAADARAERHRATMDAMGKMAHRRQSRQHQDREVTVRYGRCTRSMPAMILNSLIATWVAAPVPREP
jgi:hypothetical protein